MAYILLGVTGTLHYGNSAARGIDTSIYDYDPVKDYFVVNTRKYIF